jgi:hypothetical protein
VHKVFFLQSFSSSDNQHLHTLQEHVHEGLIDILDGAFSEDDRVGAHKATILKQLPSPVIRWSAHVQGRLLSSYKATCSLFGYDYMDLHLIGSWDYDYLNYALWHVTFIIPNLNKILQSEWFWWSCCFASIQFCPENSRSCQIHAQCSRPMFQYFCLQNKILFLNVVRLIFFPNFYLLHVLLAYEANLLLHLIHLISFYYCIFIWP